MTFPAELPGPSPRTSTPGPPADRVFTTLAELIGGDPGPGTSPSSLRLRQGTVAGTPSAGLVTVNLAGDTNNAVAGVRQLDSATLANGDTVWLLQSGGALLVIGKVGPPGTTAAGERWTAAAAGQGGTIQSLVGLELYHPSSTPHIDFHRAASSAGDSNADYNMRIINSANGVLEVQGGTLAANPLRVGAGNNELYVGPWAANGDYCSIVPSGWRSANASNYGILFSNADSAILISPKTDVGVVYFRDGANGPDRMKVFSDVLDMDMPINLKGHPLYTKAHVDSAHQIKHYGPGDFLEYMSWNEHKFWGQNGHWGSIGPNPDGVLAQGGWLRTAAAGTGFYNNSEGCGMRAGNLFGTSDSIDTQHNETMVIGRKLSQGGWATAGIESFSEASNGVPWVTLHASGCCTSSWRKDSGASDIRVINSGGGCDWVYAANHPICSEAARKRNISPVPEYGLKTLRRLEAIRYQYKPSDEFEIWQWEDWKARRARGEWNYAPSDHMGWDTWHIGYTAEEMVNLVPEVVGLHPDGTPKGIDYGNLVVVAIAAINELADRIEDLEAERDRRLRHAPAA